MQDIIFGFLLLVLAALLFVGVVVELATWVMVLLGIAFLFTVMVWMLLIGDKRRKRRRRQIE
jgi:Flp pilus assembly protein TadB